MSFEFFMETRLSRLSADRLQLRDAIPGFQEYFAFTQQQLAENKSEYAWIPRDIPLRRKLLNELGFRSISEMKLILALRGDNYGLERDDGKPNVKMVNERIYDLGEGVYLCHSWRGEDKKCDFGSGDVELVKFGPNLEGIFLAWVETMKDPVY